MLHVLPKWYAVWRAHQRSANTTRDTQPSPTLVPPGDAAHPAKRPASVASQPARWSVPAYRVHSVCRGWSAVTSARQPNACGAARGPRICAHVGLFLGHSLLHGTTPLTVVPAMEPAHLGSWGLCWGDPHLGSAAPEQRDSCGRSATTHAYSAVSEWRLGSGVSPA